MIDTSVLLSDPRALLRFAEHEVILPIVVITELEGKRHDPELGYFARKALRLLDDLRVEHGGLDRPIPLGHDGGTLMVELNHISAEVLPAGFRGGDNDSRILAVAKNLANEGRDVTVVSKDLPMRVKASAMGLQADEYRNELVKDSGWTGVAEAGRERGGGCHPVRARAGLHPGRRPRCRPTPGWSCSPAAARPWAGWARTSRCAW